MDDRGCDGEVHRRERRSKRAPDEGGLLFAPGRGDSSAYEARVGIARLRCGPSACAGVVGSVGYHHQSIAFDDGLVDPPMWIETRDLGFAELRGLGQLRMFSGRVALEAALGARVYAALHTEHTSGGVNAGLLASVALHATL